MSEGLTFRLAECAHLCVWRFKFWSLVSAHQASASALPVQCCVRCGERLHVLL